MKFILQLWEQCRKISLQAVLVSQKVFREDLNVDQGKSSEALKASDGPLNLHYFVSLGPGIFSCILTYSRRPCSSDLVMSNIFLHYKHFSQCYTTAIFTNPLVETQLRFMSSSLKSFSDTSCATCASLKH